MAILVVSIFYLFLGVAMCILYAIIRIIRIYKYMFFILSLGASAETPQPQLLLLIASIVQRPISFATSSSRHAWDHQVCGVPWRKCMLVTGGYPQLVGIMGHRFIGHPATKILRKGTSEHPPKLEMNEVSIVCGGCYYKCLSKHQEWELVWDYMWIYMYIL
jgi:hypothetical protein